MTVVQINHFPGKAAGAVMMNLHRALEADGAGSYAIWGRGRPAQGSGEIRIGSDAQVRLHVLYTRVTDKTGFLSLRATRELLEKLDALKPDLVHLHCVHGYYVNIGLLFSHLRAKGIPVVWTLHDCWPFTGHCAFFDSVHCEKWIGGCSDCPQKNTYPASYCIDNSRWNWQKKRDLFLGQKMVIVTPCEWLRGVASKSFLKEYPVQVIHNGIDQGVFRPSAGDFRRKHRLEDRLVILGVASEWTKRKGLGDFLALNERFGRAGWVRIVLVGLTQKQIRWIPDSILALERTESAAELAEIYASANLYFNPTYEDNFPSTNLEALACGTPVAVYDTGGCRECVTGESQGSVFRKGDVEGVFRWILENRERLAEKTGRSLLDEERFSKEAMIRSYMRLYDEQMREDRERTAEATDSKP